MRETQDIQRHHLRNADYLLTRALSVGGRRHDVQIRQFGAITRVR
jgi:hypothetical protein